MLWKISLISILIQLFWISRSYGGSSDISVVMPEVRPQKEDTYLCTSVKVEEAKYITEFHPKVKGGHAHHIILVGCAEPGSKEKVWNCGEMHSAGEPQGDTQYPTGPQCRSGQQILYAWAMDASSLKLPKDVSFSVGGSSGLGHLVVQVHYKHASDFVKNAKLTDASGVNLVTQAQPTSKLAGVHLSVSGGNIPAESVTYLETACSYNGKVTIHPFAFRTHTHKLGRVVSGFRVRNGHWKLIGTGNPQMPQMFYPVNNTITIKPNDVIAARCVMENKGNKDVPIGNTQADEMCNFYMMYWTPNADRKKVGSSTCYGEPPVRWPELPEDIEDLASTIPGTNDVMREFIKEAEEDEQQMWQDMLADNSNIWEDAKAILEDENSPNMPEYLVEEREMAKRGNGFYDDGNY